MNYLIVSPVRAGSSWLNIVLETHYRLYNVGETLCKVNPDLIKDNQEMSEQYRENMVKMWSPELRDLPRDKQIDFVAEKKPIVAKFTPWDLYEDEKFGYDDTNPLQNLRPQQIKTLEILDKYDSKINPKFKDKWNDIKNAYTLGSKVINATT